MDSLIAAYKLDSSQLNREIQPEDFPNLARHFDNVELYASLMKLDTAEKTDVKHLAASKGVQVAMTACFNSWRRRSPAEAIYKSLLEMVNHLGNGELAAHICEHLAKKSHTPRPTLESSSAATNHSVDMGTTLTNPDEHREIAADKGATVPINPDEHREIAGDKDSSTVAGHVENFESRFITLRTRALNEITAKEVSVREFRQRLMTMPSSISSQNENFIMEKYTLFEKAESIERIFLHLNFYLSFIDFSLLEHIIDQFCGESLNKEMTRYAKDMRQFRRETTIEEVLPHLPEAQDYPKDYSKLEAKVNFDVSTATLEKIDRFRKTFAKSFKLSELLLYLFSLKKSSLLVTWLVPASLGKKLKQIIWEKDFPFFLRIDVLKLSLNEECLYSPRAKIQANRASHMQSQVISKTMLKGPLPGKLRPPLALKWRKGKDMPIRKGGHVQSVVIKNALFVGGGFAGYNGDDCTVMKLNLQQDRWTTLPQYTFRGFAMTTVNNHLLVAGGRDQVYRPTNQIAVFQSGKWTHPYPKMTTARFSSTAVSFNCYIIVAGGCGDKGLISSVEVLDVTARRWYTAQSLPEPRSYLKSTLTGNTLYLMGGYDPTDFPTNIVPYVNLNELIAKAVSNQDTPTLWQMIEDTPLEYSTPLSIGRSLLAVGGHDDSYNSSSSIHLYQPNSRRWVKVGDLSTARYNCTCSVLPSGEVIIAGGQTNHFSYLNSVHLFSISN